MTQKQVLEILTTDFKEQQKFNVTSGICVTFIVTLRHPPSASYVVNVSQNKNITQVIVTPVIFFFFKLQTTVY